MLAHALLFFFSPFSIFVYSRVFRLASSGAVLVDDWRLTMVIQKSSSSPSSTRTPRARSRSKSSGSASAAISIDDITGDYQLVRTLSDDYASQLS